LFDGPLTWVSAEGDGVRWQSSIDGTGFEHHGASPSSTWCR
jgi:hypothetical protein